MGTRSFLIAMAAINCTPAAAFAHDGAGYADELLPLGALILLAAGAWYVSRAVRGLL